MEIVNFFFIAVVSIPLCETSEYGPKRIRYEFDAVRAAMYSIRKDISALFDKTDQLNISVVKDCGLCISDNKSSCLPVTNLDERQNRTKMNDNKVFVKYQTLMKAFATEKKIKDETDRQVQDKLRSMENAISESNKVANDRDRQVQDKLRSMENAISESNRVANERNRQVQDKLRSMENAISESNKVANERDRQVQDKLRSMENAISESNRVANERDRQVQDKLQSMKESIEDLHNNITAFMRTISDRINEHLLHSKTSVKTAKTTVKPELTSVTPEITSVKPEITTDSVIKRNCTTVPESGTYTFYLEFIKSNITVYCDQETDGGGWTVFMRRQDGSVNFTRPWVDYKHGFGSPDGEFWAGNELLHKLKKERPLQLRIDMEDFNGNTAFAVYDEFKVGAEEDKYRLHLSGYSGTAGDSLINTRRRQYKHAGMQFSTLDSDNDEWEWDNCAMFYRGAWWYNSCFDANLNGPYSHGKNIQLWKGIIWYSWLGGDEALKRVEMKIR